MALSPYGVFGVVTGASVALLMTGRYLREKEWDQFFRFKLEGIEIPLRQTAKTYHHRLVEYATAIGEPERVRWWARFPYLASAVAILGAVLEHNPYFILAVPAFFFLPLLYGRELVKEYRRKLEAQTRLAEMFMTFLLRSGATQSECIDLLAKHMPSPFRDRMREVKNKKQYSTLPKAMLELSKQTGTQQLADFATLVSVSEKFGTPLSESMMRSLQLDMKLRNSKATQRYGEITLTLTMYVNLLIAFPGFGYIIYAVLSYALQIFQNGLFAL